MINQQLSRFATHENSAYPQLWRGCVGAWCPSLGPSGARLHDYSRRNNWGTLTNMDPATDWVVSGGQYALDFDGSNDYALLTPAIGGKPRATFAMWFWWAAYSNNDDLLFETSENYGTIGNAILCDPNCSSPTAGKFHIALSASSGQYNSKDVDRPTAAEWHHLGVVCDRTLGSGPDVLRVHIDGVETGTQIGTANMSGTTFGSQNLYLCCRGGSALFGETKLDDIRVYDRALNSAEVRLLATRRAIAYEPAYRPAYYTETDAGGATPWLYARRRSQIIGAGGVH